MRIRSLKWAVKYMVWVLPLVGGIEGLQAGLPTDFVDLGDVEPTITRVSRYATADNPTSRPVPGCTNRIVCTKVAAQKLKAAHQELLSKGYTLVAYGGYRPQQATDALMSWLQDESDQAGKFSYYPTIEKQELRDLGYVADKSAHSRGSTFDLSLIRTVDSLQPIQGSLRTLPNGEVITFLNDNTVDMGSSVYLFHEVSSHDSPLINEQQTAMRHLLRETLEKYGFKAYEKEWWHYTLADEPYPDTYFNVVA